MTDEEMIEIFKGVKMTFSKNCCSGIIHLLGPEKHCECWRCRQERDEVVTEESEQVAEQLSKQAQEAQRLRMRRFLDEHQTGWRRRWEEQRRRSR